MMEFTKMFISILINCGYKVAKKLAMNKRLEMELSLNHYRVTLHNLAHLELQEDSDTNYDFKEVEGAVD